MDSSNSSNNSNNYDNSDDEHAQYAEIIRKRKEAQKTNELKYRENTKQQLLQNLEKKFKTTMIGALARFEENFGELWGHGKTKLTEVEEEWREIWDETRTEILNNGNNQLRAAQDELAAYSVNREKFKTEFIVKPAVREVVRPTTQKRDNQRECLESERNKYERRN